MTALMSFVARRGATIAAVDVEPRTVGDPVERTKSEGSVGRAARSTLCTDRHRTPLSGPGLYSVRVPGPHLTTCYVADVPDDHRLAGLAVQIHYNRCSFPTVDRADALIAKHRFEQLLVSKLHECRP